MDAPATPQPPGAEPAIEVVDAAKRFGEVEALRGISVRVRRGEIFGLLGPNGSGKTTLIRCLLGLVAADRGTVTVLGHRMPDVAVLSRIGYMTQAAALYSDQSVEENVAFFASLHGAQAGVDDALRFVELTDRRRSIVQDLSGGMRTRVSMACAIVHRPELLLLDEPTVGVDPHLRVQLWSRFRDLAAGGTTIVVSSHVMDEAERCSRLGLVSQGCFLAEGTVGELLELAGTATLEAAFLALAGPQVP